MTPSKFVLGIGTGRCGTLSLAELLNNQPSSHVTHEVRPLLPWSSTNREGLVAERINRFRQRQCQLVGDVGSFYLPYVEQFVSLVPDIRIICLRRDCAEVVRSFSEWSDHAHGAPADHWSDSPQPGLTFDPVWSTIFPKYPVNSREEGIRQYWHDYHRQVEILVRKYPSNIRVFEMEDALNTEAGQREMLSFVGVPTREQVLQVGLRTHEMNELVDSTTEALRPGHEAIASESPESCVILMPHNGQIVPGCEESLRVLEQRGYSVRRVPGYSQIDVARNEIASQAILDGFQETIWIDGDIGFHPDAVERLRSHNQSIVCGVYPKTGKRQLAIDVLPGTDKMVFGKNGGLYQIRYAATGFLLVRRQVYLDIQFKLGLPLCDEQFGKDVVPYFMPMARRWRDGHWYLGEDFAFCERAQQAGHQIFADTTIRLWHVGNYPYGWEDAGRDVERFSDYTYHFND